MPVVMRLGNLWGKLDPTPGEAFDVLINSRSVASVRLDEADAREMRAFLCEVTELQAQQAIHRLRFGRTRYGKVWHVLRFGFWGDKEGTIPEFEDPYQVCFVTLCGRHYLTPGVPLLFPDKSKSPPDRICQECENRLEAIHNAVSALSGGVVPAQALARL